MRFETELQRMIRARNNVLQSQARLRIELLDHVMTAIRNEVKV